MKFITKRIHAYLDYPVALALMGLPFLLGLGASNSWAIYLSVITGVAALILTIFTNHHLGVIKLIPYAWHVRVDMLVGLTFVIIPFIINFEGIDAWYYWINGIAVLFVVSMDKKEY